MNTETKLKVLHLRLQFSYWNLRNKKNQTLHKQFFNALDFETKIQNVSNLKWKNKTPSILKLNFVILSDLDLKFYFKNQTLTSIFLKNSDFVLNLNNFLHQKNQVSTRLTP